MRICNNCQTHNLDHDQHCHACGTSLGSQPVLPWKTALLLGLVSTGCVDDKYGGEPEYGVAMMEIDMDGDGVFEEMDCDDNDPAVGEPTSWYADSDEDTFGDPENVLVDCEQPQGYVENDTDCNDQDEAIHPDASETTGDGVDSNCDGDDDT